MTLHTQNVARVFDDIVRRFRDRPAVAFGEGHVLTYGQLDRLSNQAARFLFSKGIRIGDRIALSLEKSPVAYVLILASLKAGTAYLALDPRNPPARREAILRQCTPALLFSDGPLELPQELASETILCSGGFSALEFCAGLPEQPLDTINRIAGSDPAYLMFTSGSTGVPKGAVMSHDNLLHFIGWTQHQYGFTPEDIHTHLNPLYFDNTVFDIYSTFFSGGALVPFELDALQDPVALVKRLGAMKCTVWFSVPSLLMFLQVMKVATRANLGMLRKIIFGGEGFPKSKLKHLFDEFPQTELHNVYGPTECTCICSSHLISADDFLNLDGFPTLGTPIGGFTLYILDGARPVAAGEAGELCVGGSCVGLGYFNRPDLTARAFVQNPLNEVSREIIYRTGDLVRLDPADGKLYFIGRRDLQIKHMGYRIELEEIQHALLAIPGVDEAAVLHRKIGELSAIIAVVAAKRPLNGGFIRKALANRVPQYMIPSTFHIVDRMPKNANGKTDRTALIKQYAG